MHGSLLHATRYQFTIIEKYYVGLRSLFVGIRNRGPEPASCFSEESRLPINNNSEHQQARREKGNRFYHLRIQNTDSYAKEECLWAGTIHNSRTPLHIFEGCTYYNGSVHYNGIAPTFPVSFPTLPRCNRS